MEEKAGQGQYSLNSVTQIDLRGGAAEGNTSGLNATVILPNSGHKLRVQMYSYWNAVSAERGRGTLPDVTVERKAEYLLQGIDRQKETALERLRK